MHVSGQVFRIDIDQPAELRIFPGNDTTICKNHSVMLGADPTVADDNSGRNATSASIWSAGWRATGQRENC